MLYQNLEDIYQSKPLSHNPQLTSPRNNGDFWEQNKCGKPQATEKLNSHIWCPWAIPIYGGVQDTKCVGVIS